MDRQFFTKRAALNAVFREMRRCVDEADTLCIKVYLSLGTVSLFELKGRSKTLLGRFSWKVRA